GVNEPQNGSAAKDASASVGAGAAAGASGAAGEGATAPGATANNRAAESATSGAGTPATTPQSSSRAPTPPAGGADPSRSASEPAAGVGDARPAVEKTSSWFERNVLAVVGGGLALLLAILVWLLRRAAAAKRDAFESDSPITDTMVREKLSEIDLELDRPSTDTPGRPLFGSMPRVALGIAYDGAPWQGWQTQPGGRTIQDTLESALASFLTHPVATICAGRTDTGVHALEQVIHVDTQVERRLESWVRGVNAHLPPSIRVQWAHVVGSEFHARFSATSRSYIYLLRSHRIASPILHGKVAWTHRSLDVERMQQAAAHLLGEHDFSAFRSSECQAASPVRRL